MGNIFLLLGKLVLKFKKMCFHQCQQVICFDYCKKCVFTSKNMCFMCFHQQETFFHFYKNSFLQVTICISTSGRNVSAAGENSFTGKMCSRQWKIRSHLWEIYFSQVKQYVSTSGKIFLLLGFFLKFFQIKYMFPLVENMLAIVGTASSYRKKYQFPLAETTFSVVRKILFTGKDTYVH